MAILLNTEHLKQCVLTLEYALEHLQKTAQGSVEYDVFRNAVVKGFELTLETAGKLIRKAIKAYLSNPKQANTLTYKEVLREAAKYGLLTTDEVERWFDYRDNRNDTAHDYGADFAEQTLALLPNFFSDVRNLQKTLENQGIE